VDGQARPARKSAMDKQRKGGEIAANEGLGVRARGACELRSAGRRTALSIIRLRRIYAGSHGGDANRLKRAKAATGNIGGLICQARATAIRTARDFCSWARALSAAGGLCWRGRRPLIGPVNPDASTHGMAAIEVDINAIQEGQIVTVKWRHSRSYPYRTARRSKRRFQLRRSDELRDPQRRRSRQKAAFGL